MFELLCVVALLISAVIYLLLGWLGREYPPAPNSTRQPDNYVRLDEEPFDSAHDRVEDERWGIADYLLYHDRYEGDGSDRFAR